MKYTGSNEDYYLNENECKNEKTKDKCVKVPEVIGRNSCQVLTEIVIPFPCKYPALAIKDIQKRVTNLIVYVCKDKVLINGVLHKNINYKTYEGNEEICYECEKLDVKFGDVKHVSVDIPFKCFIDIPGARLGDDYQVEFAGVEDCCELDILEDPVKLPDCKAVVYKALREKAIIKIDLKVLRPLQITVTPNSKNICP